MPTITRSQFAVMMHAVPHLGPKGIARLLAELPAGLPNEDIELGGLPAWRLSPDSLHKDYKLHEEAARCIALEKDKLLAAGARIAESVDRLGIRVMTVLDADFPAALREYQDPPPILYSFGNLGLLRERKFAVISSSNPSGKGIEAIRELAATLADEGLAAVTSHNTRPYKVAGLSAKNRDAPILLVLDRGLLSAFPQGMSWEPAAAARIWDLRFDPERDLVVSPFRLYDPWIGANGRERDRMVFGFADIVVAVEVREGGVMESECLRAHRKGREVYVYKPDGEEPSSGNKSLLQKGCEPIPAGWARSLLTTLDLPDSVLEPLEGEE